MYHALHFGTREHRTTVVQGIHLDPLGLSGAHVHDEFVALLADDEILVSEPARHEEGLAHGILLGQRLRILLDARLHRFLDLPSELEEPVRRHQALDPLMGPLEIVVLDPVANAADRILERFKNRLLEKLPPEMAPEGFDLAERLGVMRATPNVPYPPLLQDLLEPRLSPPGVILPTVVGEKLFRKAVFADGTE